MAENSTYGDDYVKTRPDTVDTSTAMSGVGTVTGAGTAVQGADISLSGGVFIKASNLNAGTLYVGNSGAGTVASTNGYELKAGEVTWCNSDNLNQIYFNASVGTTIYNWLKV